MLWRGLRRRGVYRPRPGWSAFSLKLLIALGALGAILWFGCSDDSAWLAMSGRQRMTQLSGLVLGGIAGYFATLWLLGFRLRDFRLRSA
jgi:putative peptidoglycan lipid II flippase